MNRSAHDWRAIGDVHYDAQRWTEAAQAFEKTLALEPGCIEVWYRLGNVCQEQGNDHRAIECFERVVALDPAHAKSWNNIGASRQKLGQDTPAAQAYRRAVESDPTLVQAALNLAQAVLRLGDAGGAATLLERAASLDPSNADTWGALARAQATLGRTAEASESYRTAMELLSPRVLPRIREAELAISRGDYAAAEAPLAAALELLPDHPTLRHMVSAVRGQTTERAPTGYVSMMFDDFAQNFDHVMRVNLDYRAPEQLAELVAPMLSRANPARVIDLGCGTGLLGAALAQAGAGANIVGIDLSGKMLERARQRGEYARLVKADLVEELERIPAATVDAVLATDVFIYLGDLQPVFAAAARVLVAGGLFAFSLESLDEGDFALRPSGRYAHSPAYVRRLAAQFHFAERRMQRIPLRRELENYIEGWLACFVAPGSPGRES